MTTQGVDEPLLSIQGLSVEVEGKLVIRDLYLELPRGETYVIFGPNGSGKTSLLMSIAGVPPYKVVKGRVLFEGRDISDLPVNERARLGIALAFQHPPEVRGVKLVDLLKICTRKKPEENLDPEVLSLAERLKLQELLSREVNVGFSGGERKRAEVLTVLSMKPKLLLLDEPDSGVDVESLKLICAEIEHYLKSTRASAVIVTHQGQILEYLRAEKACVLFGGAIYCYREPKRIFETIREVGYRACVECMERGGAQP